MKYMTFNFSCSYAGLANLLALHGLDTEDRTIALDMGLPYLFALEDRRYAAGPMLQGKRWFDLFLLPRGFMMVEEAVRREEEALGGDGRILVRPSGTEPLIRVMVEAKTAQQADDCASRLADLVKTLKI